MDERIGEIPTWPELAAAITALASPSEDSAPRMLSLDDAQQLAASFATDLRVVEDAALGLGVAPRRYARNLTIFSTEEQRRLLRSRVVLVGLGGLGGCLLEQLVRAGVGTMLAFDGDTFEESNLNRQLLATTATLGRAKALAACERAALLNPGVTVQCQPVALDSAAMRTICRQADLVLDALGGVAGRGPLRLAAAEAGVMLLSAAVAGWTGYVAAIPPGGTGPDEFFPSEGHGAEDASGTPAPAVHLAASLQAAWALRLLCGQQAAPARTSARIFDLADGTLEHAEL